jgi:hypothetical protein
MYPSLDSAAGKAIASAEVHGNYNEQDSPIVHLSSVK